MKFGEFVRELRADKRQTLREFCLKYEHDPSNWSKMERGELPPPQGREELERWAEELGLKKGSTEWYKFFDLAFIERGRIPDDVMSDQELVESLPIFFRTLKGRKPTGEDLKKVIALLKKR